MLLSVKTKNLRYQESNQEPPSREPRDHHNGMKRQLSHRKFFVTLLVLKNPTRLKKRQHQLKQKMFSKMSASVFLSPVGGLNFFSSSERKLPASSSNFQLIDLSQKSDQARIDRHSMMTRLVICYAVATNW